MKTFYKIIFLLIISLQLSITNSFSQSLLVKQWDYRFGGSDDDYFTCIISTNDGGYIIGGWSGSPVSGDKSQPEWGGTGFWDFWIIKTDSMGIKQWDKRYGGTSLEMLFSIQQTKDGGYILAGTTGSYADGDKSSPNYGYYDYWLLKIDSLGVKQWDNDFGGNDDDELLDVHQTADGGYILGGSSLSGISGNKTEPNWGGVGNTVDYWIVKTDSLGNKEWDKDIGGTDDDVCYSLQQTPDGGYILGGTSASGVNGNKTQPSHGLLDYWLVKIDSAGVIQWDKVLGGNYLDYLSSIKVTPDGGFIIGGSSGSQINGDKSQATCAGGNDYDYWIIKTDSLGNKQWDKDFGGSDFENSHQNGNIVLSKDGGYMYSATSYSPVSCDKTESNLATRQNWTVKMDSSGHLQWNKTARFPDNIQYYDKSLVIESKDGCYVLATHSSGPTGGDKTQPGQGGLDYWFAKYCDTTITSNSDLQFTIYNLQISPNPSNGIFQITFPKSNQKSNFTLEIINTLGQTVFKQNQTSIPIAIGNKHQTTIDVSFLPKGIYFMKINNGLSNSTNKLILK